MYDFKLAPVNLVPAFGPGPGSPRGLGQTQVTEPAAPPSTSAVEKAKELVGTGKAVVAFGTLFSAGTAWVGYSTGLREKGLLSGLGWVVGVGASIGVMGGLSALMFVDKVSESLKAQT